ncbi:hypothetical protein MMAG44476_33974 [Mycolicibacterium mageritense DSM 44476 = CIP 104973]|uniref:Uncharacterized protein n=1 Tax=Mycolicibacterium mageritense TaxID=53462 RepID=A0ABN5Y4K3_MYCME|nr:hypothetical protein MMAGJ_18980 [Mycolicibacterium mageritense]
MARASITFVLFDDLACDGLDTGHHDRAGVHAVPGGQIYRNPWAIIELGHVTTIMQRNIMVNMKARN